MVSNKTDKLILPDTYTVEGRKYFLVKRNSESSGLYMNWVGSTKTLFFIDKSEWENIHPDYKTEQGSDKGNMLTSIDGVTVSVPVYILK